MTKPEDREHGRGECVGCPTSVPAERSRPLRRAGGNREGLHVVGNESLSREGPAWFAFLTEHHGAALLAPNQHHGWFGVHQLTHALLSGLHPERTSTSRATPESTTADILGRSPSRREHKYEPQQDRHTDDPDHWIKGQSLADLPCHTSLILGEDDTTRLRQATLSANSTIRQSSAPQGRTASPGQTGEGAAESTPSSFAPACAPSADARFQLESRPA